MARYSRRLRLGLRYTCLGYGIAHLSIGHDVAHGVIIHDAQISFTERLGDSQRYFCLSFDDLGLHFLRISLHFLFLCHSHGPPFFGFGLGNLLIGFSLIGLQTGADITAYVDIGNINGQDFKGRSCIQPLAEDGLTDFVRIFQDL